MLPVVMRMEVRKGGTPHSTALGAPASPTLGTSVLPGAADSRGLALRNQSFRIAAKFAGFVSPVRCPDALQQFLNESAILPLGFDAIVVFISQLLLPTDARGRYRPRPPLYDSETRSLFTLLRARTRRLRQGQTPTIRKKGLKLRVSFRIKNKADK